MTEITRSQRLDSVRPGVSFALRNDAKVHSFTVEVVNAGIGPALDFSLELEKSPLRFNISGPSFPKVVAAGEKLLVEFRVDLTHPLVDSSVLGGFEIRSPEERPGLLGGNDEVRTAWQEEWAEYDRRYNEFQSKLHGLTNELSSAGRLHATYRDVYGRPLSASVEIRVKETPPTHWNELLLGPIEFEPAIE